MHNYKNNACLVLVGFFSLQAYANEYFGAPRLYGLKNSKPSTHSSTITVLKPKFELKNSQVCGYTDWTSAMFNARDILSGDFFNEIKEDFSKEITKTTQALSGALPSMLVCNASPTFCSIMNQAQMLAQAELSFTMDSCAILDGIANQTGIQNEALATCIRQKKISDDTLSDSAARGQCLRNGVDDNSVLGKIGEVAKNIGETIYDSQILNSEACRDKGYEGYDYSSHAYSTRGRVCRWMDEIFPGVTVQADATIQNAGTFQPIASRKLDQTLRASDKYLVQLLDLMHQIRYGLGSYAGKKLPKQRVITHPDVMKKLGYGKDGKLEAVCASKNGSGKCLADLDKLPPIYSPTDDGEPRLLIEPALLYELVELVGPEESVVAAYEAKPSRIELLISRLSHASSYMQVADALSTLDGMIRNECKTNSKLQGASAQMDCRARISQMESELATLKRKQENYESHLQAQAQFYAMVDQEKARRINMRDPKPERKNDDPVHPKNLF